MVAMDAGEISLIQVPPRFNYGRMGATVKLRDVTNLPEAIESMVKSAKYVATGHGLTF
jgi:hypothetical protein